MARASSEPSLRKAMFRYALKQGIRAFDTAPLYEFGETEVQLGEVLAQTGTRPDTPVQVFSKVGLSWREDSSGPVHFETTAPDGRKRVIYRDSRPASIRRDVEESLSRLGRDHLDLAQVHFRDTNTPIAETMHTLRALREEGRVKEIGVSNFSLTEVQAAAAALAPVPLSAVQIRLNLLQRRPLDAGDLVAWCRSQGIAVLAYSPLAEGRLARAPDGTRQKANRIDQALTRFADLSAESDLPMAAVATAWLTSQPGVTGAVAGASTPEQLDGLIRSAGIPAALIRQTTDIFRNIELHNAWEGPSWKRKLRGLVKRFR